VSTPEEGDDFLYAKDVQARIEELLGEQLGTDPGDWADSPEKDELEELLSLRQQCYDTWGGIPWDDNLSLISSDYTGTYAHERAKDIYGEAADTIYWDDDLWAENYFEPWNKVTFGNTTYWGDGKP
jgi:hypothetical protein